MTTEGSELTLWEQICRKKAAQREAKIPAAWCLSEGWLQDDRKNVTGVPSLCGILSPKEVKITETDAVELVDQMLSRQYSSYEVTLAFCKRAAIVQQLVNCLSETFFDKALTTASAIDAKYAADNVPAGCVHGLPVSLKDCFKVRGTDATIGYTAYADNPTHADEESEITKIMRESGAVLFCKTNAPVGMMAGETYNPIFGYTTNPYNRSLSSGGSSGGEAALLAMRGSPLGVGTDVGGSIRIPASFCGLFSLKPSAGRFPTYGIRDSMEGLEAVKNTVGPMASSLAAVEMWVKAVVGSRPWRSADPDCLPIPWRQVVLPEQLCIGLWVDDGIVALLPPVKRALLETKAALEAAGHRVVDFAIKDPTSLEPLKTVMYRTAAADTVGSILAETGQPWPRGYEMLEAMVGQTPSPTVATDLWKAQKQRTDFARSVLQAWNDAGTGEFGGLDAVLLPCTPWPACAHYAFSYDTYTSLWNMLDYCGTTLPVTEVSPHDVDKDYRPRNTTEARIWEDYDPATMLGCPVTVQLVGRRLHEEHLLAVTKVCHNALVAMRGGNGDCGVAEQQ